jgi:hypothetical protein
MGAVGCLSGFVRLCLDFAWSSCHCRAASGEAALCRLDGAAEVAVLAEIARVAFAAGFGCQRPGQTGCALPEGQWRKAGSRDAVCPPIDYRFWRGGNGPWVVCVGRWVDLRVLLSTVYRREEYLRLA